MLCEDHQSRIACYYYMKFLTRKLFQMRYLGIYIMGLKPQNKNKRESETLHNSGRGDCKLLKRQGDRIEKKFQSC